jgi:predicted TIM-barrel fold metal-dependent hydrolase
MSKHKHKGNLIDFRVRPPLAPFKILFDFKLRRHTWENRFNLALFDATSPSMFKVGEQEGLNLLKKELDEAGVDYAVTPGWNVSAGPKPLDPSGTQGRMVSDQMLVDLSKSFDNRLFGLHGLDLGLSTNNLVAGLEWAVTKHGLCGAVMEPGHYTAPDGGILSADHKKLYPLYETLIKLDVFLMHQSGIYAGPDIGANDWTPLDRVMQAFPKLKVVLAHGGYPRVIDALALATKHPNLHLSPDIYCHFPGGRLYVEAISMLPDQFIYASAYPLGPVKESAEMALKFPLSSDVLEKYMYRNAARLLRVGTAKSKRLQVA